jgi:transposase
MAGASAACRRLMTIPGVGQVTALTFVAAIDDPFRIRRSRDIGAIWAWSQAVSVGGGRLHHPRALTPEEAPALTH